MWVVEPIPLGGVLGDLGVMPEPAQRLSREARRQSLKDTARIVGFFVAVCMLSCLFGAMMIGMLALLVT